MLQIHLNNCFLFHFNLFFVCFPTLNCVTVTQSECGVVVLGLIMVNSLLLVGNGRFFRLVWKVVLTIMRVFASIVSVG